MNSKRKSIHFDVSKVPVLFLLFSLFAVNYIFNADAVINSNNIGKTYSQNNIHKGQHAGYRNETHNNSPKKSLRLNKRFQSAEFSGCNMVTIDIPFSYLVSKYSSRYINLSLHPSLFTPNSLRGPPFSV
jgi:hypothetical protein